MDLHPTAATTITTLSSALILMGTGAHHYYHHHYHHYHHTPTEAASYDTFTLLYHLMPLSMQQVFYIFPCIRHITLYVMLADILSKIFLYIHINSVTDITTK